MKSFKHLLAVLPISLSLFSSVTPAFAATPDGHGPWADHVVSFSQGLQKGGLAVLAARSNPTAALGIAEGDTIESHFVSLGFNGQLTLKFKNGISGGVFTVESTNLPYFIETAKIELSKNGKKWFTAGTVSRTGSVSQPEGLSCARYVRITDTSDANLFESTADGFDVDGVKALGENCKKQDDNDNDDDFHNNSCSRDEDKIHSKTDSCYHGNNSSNCRSNSNGPRHS